MRLRWIDLYRKRAAVAQLVASVHFDAFSVSPRTYLTALWWHLRRKRVRARGQLAPLLSQARRAYDLWLLTEESGALRQISDDAEPSIVALVDVGTQDDALAETLTSLSAANLPAILIGSPEIVDIAQAAQHINWTAEPWLMPIAPGDRLARAAGNAYKAALAHTDARIAYADDDLIDRDGRRTDPHFKPDWNSELFRTLDYVSGACIFRSNREELQALGESNDWAREIIRRRVDEAEPLHVRQVLHHRRSRPAPRVPAAPTLLTRDLPLVTVIVPTRNRVDLLETCLRGLDATDYPNLEVIVVDNDSDDPKTITFIAALDPTRYRILHHGGAFNYSAINNRAVREARGKLLCLLNNDIEVIDPNWLAIMANQALRPDVGAVGAQLLYPDGRIQHAGVVIGMGHAAGHAHRLLRQDEAGYFHRHQLPQFVSAVTAACLVVMRERFLAVGGLDEVHFPVAYNDVDLCMRLNRGSWQSFYEPRAKLVHHESVSRGTDRDPVGAARLAAELEALQRLWGTKEVVDPFHHPQLSRASERFVTKLWDGL